MDDTKVCDTCLKRKPESEFPVLSAKLETTGATCLKCKPVLESPEPEPPEPEPIPVADDSPTFCRICKQAKPRSQISSKSRVCSECVPRAGHRKVREVVKKHENRLKSVRKRVAREKQKRRHAKWESLPLAADRLGIPVKDLRSWLHAEGYMSKELDSYKFTRGKWVEKHRLVPSDMAFMERVCKRAGRRPSGNRRWTCRWSISFLQSIVNRNRIVKVL